MLSSIQNFQFFSLIRSFLYWYFLYCVCLSVCLSLVSVSCLVTSLTSSIRVLSSPAFNLFFSLLPLVSTLCHSSLVLFSYPHCHFLPCLLPLPLQVRIFSPPTLTIHCVFSCVHVTSLQLPDASPGLSMRLLSLPLSFLSLLPFSLGRLITSSLKSTPPDTSDSTFPLFLLLLPHLMRMRVWGSDGEVMGK